MASLYLFNFLGLQELIIVFLAIFLLFGPDKIPALARSLGKFMKNIQKYKQQVSDEIQKGMHDEKETLSTSLKEVEDVASEIRSIKESIQKDSRGIARNIENSAKELKK